VHDARLSHLRVRARSAGRRQSMALARLRVALAVAAAARQLRCAAALVRRCVLLRRGAAAVIDVSDQRQHALKIALWIIIASEALLFAGLFALYASYRAEYPREFHAAASRDLGT